MYAVAAGAGCVAAFAAGSCAFAQPKLFTSDQVSDITMMVSESYKIPLMPATLQGVIVGKAVQTIVAQMEAKIALDGPEAEHFKEKLQMALDGGIDDDLVDSMVSDLNGTLDLPLVDEATEQALLAKIIRTMLSDQSMVTSGALAVTEGGVDAIQGLLDPAARKALVDKINLAVDIPLLNEDQEEVIIAKALDQVASVVQTVIPASWLAVVEGSTPVEIDNLKLLVVQRTLSLVPSVPGIPNDRKEEFVAGMVTLLFEAFFNGSAMEQAMTSLNVEDRLIFLRKQEATIEAERDALVRSHTRKMGYYERRLTDTERDKVEAKTRR